MSLVDPAAVIEHEIGGTTYKIRGLTAREKMRVISLLEASGEAMEVGADLTERVVRYCLVGWSDEVKFSANQDENMDRLDIEAYVGLARKILEISGISREQEKK